MSGYSGLEVVQADIHWFMGLPMFAFGPILHTLSPLAVSFSTAVLLILLCTLFGSHRILRWPLLLISVVHVTVELSAVALLVALMGLWDELVARFRAGGLKKDLLAQLKAAHTWTEYEAAGRQLDRESDECNQWRFTAEDPMYNAILVRTTFERLRSARDAGDMETLLGALGTCVRKSFSGIDNEALYAHCHSGTKLLIEKYVDEVVTSLAEVQSHLGSDPLFDERVRSFLHRSQRIFGRTCLALSGGGGLANFSWGVARALFEQRLLPSLICGTSAGAVVGATLCTHTDSELSELLTSSQLSQLLTSFEEPRWVTIRRFLTSGTLYDAAHWKPKIEALCNQARHPDLTFQEAFELTGRELCVTVTARRRHEPPLVLSRLSAPDVTVASAVLATVAMPFLIPAQRLVCKASDGRLRPWVVPSTEATMAVLSAEAPNTATPGTTPGSGSPGSGSAGAEWRDGSIVHDTPREQLAQHFGVSFTVASQCNPHVVPLFIALRPTAGKPAISRLQRGRSEWRGGFALSAVLVLLLTDAKKWLTLLRELQIMPLILDTDWSGLFLQDFMGDVTIIPPLGLKDYTRMLSDPTPGIMQRYLDVGQRETWRKMPMLATRLRIAHALQALQAAFSDGTDGLTGARSTRAPSQAEALSPGYGVGTPMKRRDSKLCF